MIYPAPAIFFALGVVAFLAVLLGLALWLIYGRQDGGQS